MPRIIFSEAGCSRENLWPFTLTRRIHDIRIGALTIREKWERLLGMPAAGKKMGDYLDAAGDVQPGPQLTGSFLLLASNLLPDAALLRQVKKLKTGEALTREGRLLAARFTEKFAGRYGQLKGLKETAYTAPLQQLEYPWQIAAYNDQAIRFDFALLTRSRRSRPVDKTCTVTDGRQLFVEPGAVVLHSIINTTTGPVYIGKNALVQEGCIIRGPFVLGEGAVLKMGTKIYGATTLGPYCTGGGEIKNSVMAAYSNKGHDGYLGDSVIGEWCNLGAGTSTSNVKNNCSTVQYNNGSGSKLPPAGIKGGLLMGDHSKAAINTSFYTGAVAGVCCNFFGPEPVSGYTGNFRWGNAGSTPYRLAKALDDIGNWKKLKGHTLTDADKKILKHIFDQY